MLIKIKSLTGRMIEFDVNETDKVATAKLLLEKEIGIPPKQLTILFNGKPMNDEKTFKDSKVVIGSVLHVVPNIRG